MNKNKKFDCVNMKWQGAERVLRETAGMTQEERLHYWELGTQELLTRQKALREAKNAVESDTKQAA